MKAVKMIKYINGTCDYELLYHRGIHFELYASTDSDYAKSRSNQKSTSGAYYFPGKDYENVRTKLRLDCLQPRPNTFKWFGCAQIL